jgi:hypothetical protein
MKKSQNIPVWLSGIAHFGLAGKKAQQWCTPAEKSVIYMILMPAQYF